MTNEIEFAGATERIDRVLRRLINGIRKERGLSRITIVTPTHQASFFLRRALAREGLFNVDFKRLEDIAEQIAGRDFNKPHLHDLQASEFVFEAARANDGSLGAQLGGPDVSPQLQTALHATFRELELLDRDQLDRLAAKGDVQRELVGRFDRYMEFASDHRSGKRLADRAAEIINDLDGPTAARVAALGTVLLIRAAVVAPVQRPLFDALSAMRDAVTISTTDSPSGTDLPGIPAEGAARLNPIGVPDVAEEVRSVVRDIVQGARAGTRFARMAVVFEDDSYAARVGEALELAGIPVSGPDRTALSDSPEGQFVIGLLDIFENDFTRLDLTAWLSTAPIQDPETCSPVLASRWDALSRKAGVTYSVANSWIPRLTQYAERVVVRARRSERLDEGRANEVEAAESDAAYANTLRDFVEVLAGRGPGATENSWSGFGQWLRNMTTDYLAATQTSVAESRRTRLFDLIDRLETLETPGEAPGYGHCAGVLREQLGRRSAGLRSLGSGVYVGPIWTTAGCPFDTVFVLGMTEARYPGKGFSDPLLPDPVKREIDATGEYLGTVERTIEQSRLSFLSVLSSADSVFLYWPSGVPGAAREFGPARWFLDAARVVSGEPLLQAGQLMTGPVTGVSVRNRRDVLNLPATDAGEEQEYDVLSARNWSRAENDPAAFPLSEVAPSIAGSVRFEAGQTGAAWSEYDGKINLPEVDPRSHETTGSATAFETYAACPYRYFLSRRLHVEPTESPEPELALDALTFGTLIHDVLEKFALWRMEFDAETKPGRADQESWMRTEISKHIAVLKDETPGRSMGAWQIEESRAWLILRQWLRREPTTAGQPDMRQVEAEYSFGRGGAGTSDERPKKSGPPVEVQTATGKIVKFRGQVDRVDISEDGSRVVVYDYKSGSTAAYSKLDTDPTRHGTKLQLPLYSLAVAHKYPDADVTASYWFVREAGSNELKPGPGKYRKDLAGPALAAAVETIVDGIDHGVFPARPGGPATWGDGGPSFENCLFCEYVRVCPKSKARDWIAKRGSDPALNDYLELAEDGQ